MESVQLCLRPCCRPGTEMSVLEETQILCSRSTGTIGNEDKETARQSKTLKKVQIKHVDSVHRDLGNKTKQEVFKKH